MTLSEVYVCLTVDNGPGKAIGDGSTITSPLSHLEIQFNI